MECVSWDHYAFALYYPREETLELAKEEIENIMDSTAMDHMMKAF